MYFMQGKLDEALKQINKALGMKKESPYFNYAYWLKVLIYKEKKNQRKIRETVLTAKKYIKNQIEKNPKCRLNYSHFSLYYSENYSDLL